MSTRRIAAVGAAVAAGVALALTASASARITASVVLFKNGHAYCAAAKWTKAGGFVGCSARIGGTWQSAVLMRRGRAVRSDKSVAPGVVSAYRPLRTHWRGGPFL